MGFPYCTLSFYSYYNFMLFIFTLFISPVCVPSFFQLPSASTLTSDRSDRDKGPHHTPPWGLWTPLLVLIINQHLITVSEETQPGQNVFLTLINEYLLLINDCNFVINMCDILSLPVDVNVIVILKGGRNPPSPNFTPLTSR